MAGRLTAGLTLLDEGDEAYCACCGSPATWQHGNGWVLCLSCVFGRRDTSYGPAYEWQGSYEGGGAWCSSETYDVTRDRYVMCGLEENHHGLHEGWDGETTPLAAWAEDEVIVYTRREGWMPGRAT